MTCARGNMWRYSPRLWWGGEGTYCSEKCLFKIIGTQSMKRCKVIRSNVKEVQARVHHATRVDSQASPSLTALQMSFAIQLELPR